MSAMPRGEEIIKVALESLQENSYQPDEDEILDENLWPVFRKEVSPKDEPLVQKICYVPTLSPWASQMLTGRYHELKAWLVRGHEFADKVKPEGGGGLRAVACKGHRVLLESLEASARDPHRRTSCWESP